MQSCFRCMLVEIFILYPLNYNILIYSLIISKERIVKRYIDTGNVVDYPRSGRSRTVRSKIIIEAVRSRIRKKLEFLRISTSLYILKFINIGQAIIVYLL